MYSRSGFIIFEEMAKRGLGTIAFEIPGTFLIKSWFAIARSTKFFNLLERGYTINLFNTNVRPVQRIPKTAFRDGSGFQ
jgi:hypothetical protein